MTAPAVLPQASVAQAALGSAPDNPGLGLDRALEGISSGARMAAGAFAQINDYERRVAEKAKKRDEDAYQAQAETWIAKFQADAIPGVSSAADDALSKEIPLRLDAFEADIKSREQDIDTNIENEELNAKAKLWLSQIAQRGRERIKDQSARDTADDAMASLTSLQSALDGQVAGGTLDPQQAALVYGDRVNALTGTALGRNQAVKLSEQATAGFYARQADSLYASADTDPDSNATLRELLASPEAGRWLDAGSVRQMSRSLDAMMTKAEMAHASRSLAAAQRSVSETLPRGIAPESWWAAHKPIETEVELNNVVSFVMEQPGTSMPGSIVDGRPATEGDVRERLFVPALKASAAAGDEQGFQMFVRLLRPVGNIEANASPHVEEIIADQARQMAARKVEVDTVDAARQRIDAVWSSGGSGVGNPAFRSQKAVDQWAEEKYVSDPTVTLGKLARFTVNAGAPLPSVVRKALDDGFAPGATQEQTLDALATLRDIRTIDPNSADSVAGGLRDRAIARTLLNLPDGVALDEDAVRVLTSPRGRMGLAAADDVLSGAVKGVDITAASQAMVAGISADVSMLPVTARNAFDASFAFRMAQEAERNDSGMGDAAIPATATAIAKQAMADVLSRYSTVRTFDRGGSSSLNPFGWISDNNATMLVDPGLYGLKPGGTYKSGSGFADFLEAGRSKFDSIGFLGLDFNLTRPQDVRPDLGFVGDWDATDSLGQTVAVPIIDRDTGNASGFLLWDPVNQIGAGEVTPSDPTRFATLNTRLSASGDYSLRDPERAYRKPLGVPSVYMSEGSALLAERFLARIRNEALTVGLSGADIDEYVNERAINLGWKGFSAPVTMEPQQ